MLAVSNLGHLALGANKNGTIKNYRLITDFIILKSAPYTNGAGAKVHIRPTRSSPGCKDSHIEL